MFGKCITGFRRVVLRKSIYRGIVTGFNQAFIVDHQTRDQLVATDAKSEEILKPVLRGRDIGRYRVNWDGLWIISTLPSMGLNIEDYPAVKEYLNSFTRDRLAQIGQTYSSGMKSRSKTRYKWFEVQGAVNYHTQFSNEKLVWIELVDQGRFALEVTGKWMEATTFMLIGNNLRYLCGFLNSRLVHWYMRTTAPTSGMGVLRWKKAYVESIPVVQVSKNNAESNKVAQLVARMIDLVHGGDTIEAQDHLQAEINERVYQQYGLTDKEIKFLNEAMVSN